MQQALQTVVVTALADMLDVWGEHLSHTLQGRYKLETIQQEVKVQARCVCQVAYLSCALRAKRESSGAECPAAVGAAAAEQA